MKYVSYSPVDVVTRIPVTQAPALNGPADPEGVVFGFALESQYPTQTPTYYGTTKGATDVLGILAVIDKATYDAAQAHEMDARLLLKQAPVNLERDRRLSLGITFQNHVFQTDPDSRERIDRSRISAMAAIMGGVQPGDLRWHGLPVDFFWIGADDTRVPMDAQTMVAFGNGMAAREGLLIIAGNDIKKRIAAGETVTIGDDALWPA